MGLTDPSHLTRSLLSLRSISLKKIAGKDLIDNKELLGLFHATRSAVNEYQTKHQIPEMKIVLERMPDPITFETRPYFFEAYRVVYEIILLPVSIIVAVVLPLTGIPLVVLVLAFNLVVRIVMHRRNSRITEALHQVAGSCSSIEMLVRNNESYVSAKAQPAI